MKKHRVIVYVSIIGLAAVGVVGLAISQAWAGNGEMGMCQGMGKQGGGPAMGDEGCTHARHGDKGSGAQAKGGVLEQTYSEQLPAALKAVDEAVAAVKSGDKEGALAKLEQARTALIKAREALGEVVNPEFVNDRCPMMMGMPIQADKVTASLIREYEGQRVAFCCGSCPAAWDKLSTTEKEVKLGKVKTKTPAGDVKPDDHSRHTH